MPKALLTEIHGVGIHGDDVTLLVEDRLQLDGDDPLPTLDDEDVSSHGILTSRPVEY